MWFLGAVFVAIALVVAASYIVYSSQPRPPSPVENLVFQRPAVTGGNASFVVQSVSGGPYAYSGFRVNLVVNGFAGQPMSLGPSQAPTRITIGPNTYRTVWFDSDGDRAMSIGDPFIVSGDGTPLPALSVFEFDLQWQNTWTAKAFWSTP